MSELTKKDFHSPLNSKAIDKILSRINRVWSEQATAASLAANPAVNGNPLDSAGNLFDVFFVAAGAAASGESMTIDVFKNGVSILTGVFTYDSSKAADARHSLLSLVSGDVSFAVGDVITVTRVYTAGGGPTPIANNKVVVEYGRSVKRVDAY